MQAQAEEMVCAPEEGSKKVELDKIKIRELELQTQYELKYLSDSLVDLKAFVRENKEIENLRTQQLDKKVNWITMLVLAQLAGADVPALIHLLTKFGGM